MRLGGLLFALCRMVAAVLLPVLTASGQCTNCGWTYQDHEYQVRVNDICWREYEDVIAFYCGYYQYSYYYYIGYYCREQ